MREPDRRDVLRATLAGAGLTLAGTVAGQETTPEEDEEDAGLVTVQSDEDFQATVERIRTDIEESGNMTLVTTVDHAENANSAGMNLRPTTLFLLGNPQIGTRLMQRSRTAGIDLPQKMLVWEAGDGSVNVTYNDPEWVAERHEVEASDMLIQQISSALESLATGE